MLTGKFKTLDMVGLDIYRLSHSARLDIQDEHNALEVNQVLRVLVRQTIADSDCWSVILENERDHRI